MIRHNRKVNLRGHNAHGLIFDDYLPVENGDDGSLESDFLPENVSGDSLEADIIEINDT